MHYIKGTLYKIGRHDMVFRFSESLDEWVNSTMTKEEYRKAVAKQKSMRREEYEVSNGGPTGKGKAANCKGRAI